MSFKLRFSAFMLAFFQSYPAISATAITNPDVDVMTVTGNRFGDSELQKLTVINTIEREEIALSNPKSVVDILETLPGVSVIRSGGSGQTASIHMRGTNSNHVLVLVDGIRIGSATLGAVSFNNLSPENIERIEVVQGPRAAIWGSDAIGGVIQIFTRQLQSGEGFASIEYGSDNYQRASAGIGISHGDGHTALSVNKERSDGYDIKDDQEFDDDGYDRLGLSINGMQQFDSDWSMNWIGQLDTGNYEYDNTRANTADYKNYLWNITTKYQIDNFISKLSYGQSQESNDNYRDDAPLLHVSLYETTRDQVRWSNQYLATQDLTLSGGIDLSREAIIGDYSIDQRTLYGMYSLVRYQLGDFIAEGALRYDDVENIDSQLSYNTSLSYAINEQWRVTGSAASAFKAPTFNDLYWPDTGNPNLVSETAKNIELLLNYQGDIFNGYLSVFQNNIDNLIQWAPGGKFDASGYEIWQPANIASAEISGIELLVNFTTWQLDHRLGYSFIDAIDLSTDTQLLGRSKHEFDYSLGYAWQNWELLMNYHYQGKRNDGDSNLDGATDFLSAYHQVNFAVGYNIGDDWNVRVNATNLLNQEIISSGGFFGSERQLFVSLSYQVF